MKKSALITGAAGLVGGELTKQLLKDGNRWGVHCTVRGDRAKEHLAGKLKQDGLSIDEVIIHYIDLENYEQVKHLMDQIRPDVVFHTAAKVSLSEVDGEKMVQSNLDMTHFVSESLLALRCNDYDPILMHVSSIAAFGTKDSKGVIDEKTPFTDITKASSYARSKFLSQNNIIKASKFGLKTVIVNPSVILGLNGGLGQMQTLFEMIRKGIYLYTDGEMGYIDVRDVATAMIALSQEPRSYGEIYCLNGANLSFGDLITIFGAPFKKKRPYIHISKWMLSIIRSVSWFWSKIRARKPLITKSIVKHMTNKAVYDGSKIERTIPTFKYTPIETTAQYVADNL